MPTKAKDEKLEKLKTLLESGTPFQYAVSKISGERAHYSIEDLEPLGIRSNTVGGCPIASQYSGCENWKK